MKKLKVVLFVLFATVLATAFAACKGKGDTNVKEETSTGPLPSTLTDPNGLIMFPPTSTLSFLWKSPNVSVSGQRLRGAVRRERRLRNGGQL